MGKLDQYWKKRHFDKTKEPRGKVVRNNSPKLIFVIQHHWAKNEHYDFRLEMGNVLKSWAVPKCPPEKTGIRRLAIMTEPHPFSYAKFQGTITKGNYGAGKVKIWDSGRYQLIEKTMKKIVFDLHGRRLHGRYTLLFFQPPKNWLLYKSK